MDLAVERLKSLRVADVMARAVTTIPAEQPLTQVAKAFVEHEISWAPIVDRSQQCIGVISATDFLRREADSSSSPSNASAHAATARDYMTSTIQSISPQAGILHAARIMCAQHLHRLLVLDDDGRPAGVISSMDVTAALVNVMDEMNRTARG